MQNKKHTPIILTILFTLTLLFIGAIPFQDNFAEATPTGGNGGGGGALNVSSSGTYVGAEGWYDGYVVYATPGTHTYELILSATPGMAFPLKDVHLVMLISDAAHDGGLTQIELECSKAGPKTYYPSDFTSGFLTTYGANGGAFQEPDYYGYNDAFTITPLSKTEVSKSHSGYPITVTITFDSEADENTKIYFLAYGYTNNGKYVKAPFSEGTLFVVPEYPLGALAAVAAGFAALALVKTKKR